MSSKGQALGTLSQGRNLSVAAVDVDAAGNVSVQQLVPLTNAQINLDPDASATSGVNGRHMVVWTECNGSCNPVNTDVWGAILGNDGVILEIRPIANSTRSEFQPFVDGDGSHWLVAYEVYSSVGGYDTECALVFWDSNSGSSYNGGTVSLAANPGITEISDPVVFTGGSYITAYDDGQPTYNGGGQHMFVLDAIDGRRLEVGPRFSPMTEALGASQHWRRSGPGDIAMLVDGAFAYWYRVDDGITTDLGGGCGRGGHIGVSGAVSKLKTMTLHLRDALPAVPAVLILGSSTVNLACGTCTLVPDPASGIALPLGVTDNHGNASVQVPITNLYAATFIEQWAILGGNACALGLELSNAVQVQIQ